MKVGNRIMNRGLGRSGVVISRQPKIVSRSKGPVVVNYYRVLYDNGQVGRVCPALDDIEVVS